MSHFLRYFHILWFILHFICEAVDEALAQRVTKELEGYGFEVHLSERDIKPGDFWSESIATTIEESNYFFVLISERSMKSYSVMKEVAESKEKGLFIIPIIVGNPAFNDDWRHFLHSCVYLRWNFNDPKSSVERLIKLLPI